LYAALAKGVYIMAENMAAVPAAFIHDLEKEMQENVNRSRLVAGVVLAIRYELDRVREDCVEAKTCDELSVSRFVLVELVLRLMPVLEMLESYTEQTAKIMQELCGRCDEVHIDVVAATKATEGGRRS